MGQITPPSNHSAKPGINPRDALDMLDIRTRRDTSELAGRSDAGPDLLHYLATRGSAPTRAAVAANPGTSAVTNRLLVDDVSEDVRAELAGKIARLMPGLSERESARIYALTVETLECLARDAAVRVRAVLADSIKAMDCIPHDVVMALARDLDTVVAAPILEYSPLLSSADLMEIIACGQVSDALAAIARRRTVDGDVSAQLVQTLDVSAVAALLVNPNAEIRKETMDLIIDQAEEIGAWQMPLALRADLSARAIRRIAGLVGSSIIERLAARNDLSDATRTRLNRELRARLAEERDITESGGERRNPADVVAKARADGRLDDWFVEQAAQHGQREVVVHAVAALAQVDPAIVRNIFGSGHAKPLVSLIWHAHLSMRVAFKIQTFLLKMPSHEVLPARGGIGFPLSREEMRWHLSYFNISA
jgi:uncharacterized protein (DUF2336 family)